MSGVLAETRDEAETRMAEALAAGALPLCAKGDSDGTRTHSDQELAPPDVVPMHRMSGVRPRGAFYASSKSGARS